MSKLRFCLAGEYPADTSRIAGGVLYVTCLLAETFAERTDIDFHLVASAKGMDGVKVVEKPGMTVHYVGEHRGIAPNILVQGSRIAPILRDLKPDVVNSHHLVTTEAAVRAGCKVVHTIHGVAHKEVPFARGSYRLSTALQGRLLRKYISKSDAVTSVSHYGLDSYAPWIHGPSAVIPVPVEDLFARVPALKPSKSIVFAGRISLLKNLMTLVRAMLIVREKHPDAKLQVCGGGLETSYGQSVSRFVAGSGLEGAVCFHGIVDRETLARQLGESVCLALASRQENTPVVIAQAMSSGRPVIATPVGGVPEMIQDGVTGFLADADDPRGFADRIIELLDDFDKARSMGSAAREIALERYNRHSVADRILKLCSSLVTGEQPAMVA